MKINPEAIGRFLDQPDPKYTAALIHGEDDTLIVHYRQRLVNAVRGDAADTAEAVSWLDARDVERGEDAVRRARGVRGMFAEIRLIVLEYATNRHTNAIKQALETTDPEDSFLVVCAGNLDYRSTLRKLFEAAGNAAAICAVGEPAQAAGLRRWFADHGGVVPDTEALEYLTSLSRELDWGSFQMLLETVSLYVMGGKSPFGVDAVDSCCEAGVTSLDTLVDAVADGSRPAIARSCRRLAAAGVRPVSAIINVSRHFQLLHQAQAKAGGGQVGYVVRRLPMHPSRRPAMERHAAAWKLAQVEKALLACRECDLALRGGSPAPDWAVAERALMRIAGMRPGRPLSTPA